MKIQNIKKSVTGLALAGLLLSPGITTAYGAIGGNDILLTHKGTELKMVTTSATVNELLKSEGITLDKGEIVKPGIQTGIKDNMKVTILSPQVRKIAINGKVKEYNVAGETVREILRQANIVLRDSDTVTPALDKKVKDDETIFITRESENIINRQHIIPFETEVRKDDSLAKGQTKVLQEGENGIVSETVEQQIVDGNVISGVVIGTEIIKEPVTKIVAEGTKEENMIHGKKYVKKIVMEGTAYDPSAGSMTAMGTRARVGAVAVDPRVIPLGTKLYIESLDGFPTYGFAVAEDTGGAIKGNRIDLFYNTNREARNFGRRNVTVYVLAD